MTKEPTPLGRAAVAPPKRDLGSTFNAGLRGALPPKKKTTPPPESKSDEQPADAPKSPVTPAPKKASTRADGALTNGRVVYLPEGTRDGLATACAAQHKTRTVMVLNSIEATYTKLGDLIAEDLKPLTVKGALWDTVQTPSRLDQPAKRQVYITLSVQQQTVIDQLVIDSGARDRSHLITVALNAHLGLTGEGTS